MLSAAGAISELDYEWPVAGARRGFRSRTNGMLHVSVWAHGAEPADVDDLERELRAAVMSAGSVAVLMVVESRSPIASVGAQSKAVAMVQKLGLSLHAVCIVIEGARVQAAAVRSVFVALAAILRPRFRWKTFSTTEPALSWLVPNLVSPVTVDSARAMLRALRGHEGAP